MDFSDGAWLDPEVLATQLASFLGESMARVFGQVAELGKRLGDGDDEGEEFAAGLRSVLHATIDKTIRPDAQEEDVHAVVHMFADYLESWVLSSRLDASEEWHLQMGESDERMHERRLGEPVSAAEL